MEKIVFLDANSLPKEFPLPRPSFEHEWVEYQRTTSEQIVERAKDATIVVTNKCKLTAEVLEKLEKLKFIAEIATGFNNIDINYCKAHNIGVANIQGYSTESVAEHTFAMILMLSRKMIKTYKAISDGAWIDAPVFCLLPGGLISDLKDKTLTVIGSGAIGTRIGEIAKAFNMKVLKAEHKDVTTCREGYTPFYDAIKAADVISVNCPLNAQTTNLISATEIALLKDSVLIINNARGGVINESDLVDAVLSHRIAGVATDVASVEPLVKGHVFEKVLGLDNFIITPHQAWMSDAALTELTAQFKENVEAFVNGKSVRRIV